MANLIRDQSPATAVFPDLGLSGEEISMNERVTKSRLDVEAAAESSDEQYFKADWLNNVSKSKESEELVFKNGEDYLRAEFTPDGKLKCFFCPQELKQVKRHIRGKHDYLHEGMHHLCATHVAHELQIHEPKRLIS